MISQATVDHYLSTLSPEIRAKSTQAVLKAQKRSRISAYLCIAGWISQLLIIQFSPSNIKLSLTAAIILTIIAIFYSLKFNFTKSIFKALSQIEIDHLKKTSEVCDYVKQYVDKHEKEKLEYIRLDYNICQLIQYGKTKTGKSIN